jgi:Fe-S cluster biogenesis protein NfuA
MIHMTLRGGVEQAVRAAAPEVRAIEAVNWAG